MSFDLGELVALSVTIRDAAGIVANAGAVNLVITLPDGTPAAVGPVSPTSTGVYDYDYPSTQSGRHGVRWVATGVNAGAHTDVFEILAASPPQLISLADAKKHLNIPAANTTDDAEIAETIRAVTVAIERHVGAIVRTVYTETYDGGRCEIALRHYPVIAVTSVTVSGVALDPSGYTLTPAGLLVPDLPFPCGRFNVAVAYVAGMVSTLPNVAQAVKIVLKHMWETQRGSGGMRPPVGGGEPVSVGLGYTMPNRAKELLGAPVGALAIG